MEEGSDMRVKSIYETVIYASDLEKMVDFYREVLGLKLIRQSNLLLVFECPPGVLLIFDPEKASKPGRDVPSHGSEGAGHIAFSAEYKDFDAWRDQLQSHSVEIEKEVDWGGDAHSIYFRDPAGNSLELATPTLWG